ncbi:MAG: hypothetical protein NVSMB62_24450 [Acidobacteriaceae bacterium]
MGSTEQQKLLAALEANWQAEMEGHYTYAALARDEADPQRRNALRGLAAAEKHHADLWAGRIRELGGAAPAYSGSRDGQAGTLANRVGGVDLALRRLEIDEGRDIAKYGRQLKSLGDPPSVAILEEVIADEREHYHTLSNLIRERRPLPAPGPEQAQGALDDLLAARDKGHTQAAGWVGDAIYGVNDGLGSIFGIVSGVSGATLGNSHFVLIAGLAGMVASALSMGSGAYLAAKSEREIYEAEFAREREAVEDNESEARLSGRPLFDLTMSNPTVCGFAYPEDLLAPLSDARSLLYDPDPRGLLVGREAVARYYADQGAAVDPEAVVLTTSTSEGYSFLFRLLCDAGDEVLIAQPSYPLFDFLATLDDVRLVPFPLFFDHGWWLDFAELERKISERTRAIVVVHPNNPTGHWTSAKERLRLEELCVEHGLALIVDEVFLDYELQAVGSISPASFATGEHPALTFCLSGLSKIAGLPQMKASWIAAFGPHALRDDALARLEVIADTFLSMNAPVQLALPQWLDRRQEIQSQILARVRGNLAALQQTAMQHPWHIRVLTPDAGWAAVISLPGCGGVMDCAERLVRDAGVVVHPGAFYGMGEPNRAVVSLLTPASEFAEGVRRLAEI